MKRRTFLSILIGGPVIARFAQTALSAPTYGAGRIRLYPIQEQFLNGVWRNYVHPYEPDDLQRRFHAMWNSVRFRPPYCTPQQMENRRRLYDVCYERQRKGITPVFPPNLRSFFP